MTDLTSAENLMESRPIGNTRSVGLSILWTILTLGIYTFFWVYRTYDELEGYRRKGFGGVVGLIVYFVCALIGFLAITITGVLIWGEIRDLYREDGREAPHSPLWGLWLLVPIVGAFIWFIPTQRALNRFWQSKGAPGP